MSIFDFPRINIKGLVQVNVGTGNNDDYSLSISPPSSTPGDGDLLSNYSTVPPGGTGATGPGQSLRLGNSATVQPYTFNDANGNPMGDDDLVNWIQNPQAFAYYNGSSSSFGSYQQVNMIPGEWNYFGSMGLNMMNTSVVGVTVPDAASTSGTLIYTGDDPFGLINGALSFNNRTGSTGRSTAMMVDVNPEAPPASQIFTENLMLQDAAGDVVFNAKPSKASTRWINFQRNTGLGQANGAGGTFQCTIPLSALEGQSIVAMMQKYPVSGKVLAGVVFRFTLFRSLQPINYFQYGWQAGDPSFPAAWDTAIQNLYGQQGINPSYVQISGTIAPWYEGEMQSMPSGSFMPPSSTSFFGSPGGNTGPSPNNQFSLGPAMVNRNSNFPVLSVDLSATLPDNYDDPTNAFNPLVTTTNNKFTGLGALNLGIRYAISEHQTLFAPLINIDYTDTLAGDAAGWIFDNKFPETPLPAKCEFVLNSTNTVPQGGTTPVPGDLLVEQDTYFISDQSAVFAEQGLTPAAWPNMPPLPMTTDTFSSQGYQDTQISFNKYTLGQLDNTGSYMIWMANATYTMPPNQPPLPVAIMATYTPGTAITVPTGTAGVFILTITPLGTSAETVAGLIGSMMTTPMINCRILPNDPSNNPGSADYSQYYTFDSSGTPQATAALNWPVLYEQVFRNYYILYPAMSQILPMNDPNQWIGPTLNVLLDRVDTSAWNTMFNMPRTRDLSATRRWLIQAYCTKFNTASPPANMQ